MQQEGDSNKSRSKRSRSSSIGTLPIDGKFLGAGAGSNAYRAGDNTISAFKSVGIEVTRDHVVKVEKKKVDPSTLDSISESEETELESSSDSTAVTVADVLEANGYGQSVIAEVNGELHVVQVEAMRVLEAAEPGGAVKPVSLEDLSLGLGNNDFNDFPSFQKMADNDTDILTVMVINKVSQQQKHFNEIELKTDSKSYHLYHMDIAARNFLQYGAKYDKEGNVIDFELEENDFDRTQLSTKQYDDQKTKPLGISSRQRLFGDNNPDGEQKYDSIVDRRSEIFAAKATMQEFLGHMAGHPDPLTACVRVTEPETVKNSKHGALVESALQRSRMGDSAYLKWTTNAAKAAHRNLGNPRMSECIDTYKEFLGNYKGDFNQERPLTFEEETECQRQDHQKLIAANDKFVLKFMEGEGLLLDGKVNENIAADQKVLVNLKRLQSIDFSEDVQKQFNQVCDFQQVNDKVVAVEKRAEADGQELSGAAQPESSDAFVGTYTPGEDIQDAKSSSSDSLRDQIAEDAKHCPTERPPNMGDAQKSSHYNDMSQSLSAKVQAKNDAKMEHDGPSVESQGPRI